MSATLFVEAFGRLSGPEAIDSREEDLHSVFRERAELMRWATTSNDYSLLWSMEEAEITADVDRHRIGWVQVGLGVGPIEVLDGPTNPLQGWLELPARQRSTVPAVALPALIQCFDDALRRFGVVESSGFQVTASGVTGEAESCLGYLVSVLNWFNTDLKAGAEAIVAFDQGLLGSHSVFELVATLQHRNTYPFKFRTFASMHKKYLTKVPAETPSYSTTPQSDLGVLVTLPEWTPSAVGWVLASVVDAARRIEPDSTDFAVRVTQI